MVLIIDDIISVPCVIGMQVVEALQEQAENETLSSKSALRKRIYEIQLAFEHGELSDEEYRAAMADLKRRLYGKEVPQ